MPCRNSYGCGCAKPITRRGGKKGKAEANRYRCADNDMAVGRVVEELFE